MSTIMTDLAQIKQSDEALTSFIRTYDSVYPTEFSEQVEDAKYFRSNVRDQKKIIQRKKIFEVSTMTEADIIMAGLTTTEQIVLSTKLNMRTNSFKEVDKVLGYTTSGSTSYNIYRKAIRKIENYLMLPEDQKLKRLLSDQQYNIFECMIKGMKNKDIAEQLGCSLGTVKTSKNRIRAKVLPLNELSIPVKGVNEII